MNRLKKNKLENEINTYKDLVIDLQDKLIRSQEDLIAAKDKIQKLTKHEKELLKMVEQYINKKKGR